METLHYPVEKPVELDGFREGETDETESVYPGGLEMMKSPIVTKESYTGRQVGCSTEEVVLEDIRCSTKRTNQSTAKLPQSGEIQPPSLPLLFSVIRPTHTRASRF